MTLSLRAAVDNVIDFREARIHDPNWWRRYYWLMGEMDRQQALQQKQLAFLLDNALLANSALRPESFQSLQEGNHKRLTELWTMLRPWAIAGSQKATSLDKMRELYIQKYGDFTSAEWQAREEAAIKKWMESRQQEAVRYEKQQALEASGLFEYRQSQQKHIQEVNRKRFGR